METAGQIGARRGRPGLRDGWEDSPRLGAPADWVRSRRRAGVRPGLPRIPKSLPERRARDSREAPGSGRGRGRGGGRKRPERRWERPGPGEARPASVSCRGCSPAPGVPCAPERRRERRASGRKRRGEPPGLSREERGPKSARGGGAATPAARGTPNGLGRGLRGAPPPAAWAPPLLPARGPGSPSGPRPGPSVARSPQGAMASRLLHRLRHALAGDNPGEAAAGPEAEQFPESSELEDDDAEGLSSRLSGTLSFTSAEDEEDEDDEDDGEVGPDPLPSGDGASGEDAERSPPPDGQRGSQPLARQLQDFWKKSRNTLVPQRLLFEVTSANVVKDPPSKYVSNLYSGAQTSGKLHGHLDQRFSNISHFSATFMIPILAKYYLYHPLLTIFL
ncbi:sorting nexin-21 isoform X3 [Vulpes lagopus]|uniref:sorting nexin-21 isoform X3 n=1 Tax=Vulpes lagopus TaxID=494514 RepID=UPI001BCA669C|nr:sorting nexin-21 isoform X3 [Vulpes lagopus]